MNIGSGATSINTIYSTLADLTALQKGHLRSAKAGEVMDLPER
jgi:hypothetical protein